MRASGEFPLTGRGDVNTYMVFAELARKIVGPRGRARLRAELDAAYFILYSIEREDVDCILSTFQGVCDEDAEHDGAGPTRRAILDCYDQFKAAADS